MNLKINEIKVYKHKKIISENLFEFKKGLDPIDSLSLGRRALIEDWLKKHNIHIYHTINKDYTIDVSYHLDLSYHNLYEFPEYIQFGNVNGYFSCSHNFLSSLRGVPKLVTEEFFCNDNKIQFTKEDVLKVCNVKSYIYV